MNPLLCERCGRDLESDDAISIIEGICAPCRRRTAEQRLREGGSRRGVAPPTPVPPRHPRRPPPRIVPSPRSIPPLDGVRATPIDSPPSGVSHPSSVVHADVHSTTYHEGAAVHRIRSRRRDLFVGAAAGIILSIVFAGYWLHQRSGPVTLPVADGDEPLPIQLTVSPAWATVTLDGHPVGPADENGKLTLSVSGDAEAPRWIEVSAPGFTPVRRPISLAAGVRNISIELVGEPYEVAVRSEPPNAEVWIDNELKGRTPVRLTMLPSQGRTLILKRTGYADARRTLEPPQSGGPMEIDVALSAIGPRVQVDTQPTGAMIEIAGNRVGMSPVTVSLDPSLLGRQVPIAAKLPGFSPAETTLRLPTIAGSSPVVAKLELERPNCEIAVTTTPPGGRVVINGRDLGQAPVVARFDASRAGQRVAIEGRMPGSHRGRVEVDIPGPGLQRRVNVPMLLSEERVVFVLLSPTGIGSDHVLLIDSVIERIHQLAEAQSFGVLACGANGVRAWPSLLELRAATSEQKIRAYDMVRSIRPAGRGDNAQAIEFAVRSKPDGIWLFVAGNPPPQDLQQMDLLLADRDIAVNIVCISPRAELRPLASWAKRHGGMVHVLDRDAPALLAGAAGGVD